MKILPLLLTLAFPLVLHAERCHREQNEIDESIFLRQVIRSLISLNDRCSLRSLLTNMDPHKRDCVLNGHIADDLPILHRVLLDVDVNEQILEILIHNGAKPNVEITTSYQHEDFVFDRGSSAAHIAMRMQRRIKILDILNEYNTHFFRKNKEGINPVNVAFISNNVVAEKFLHTNYSTKLASLTTNDDENLSLFDLFPVEEIILQE